MSDLLYMYLAPGGTGIFKGCEIRMSNPCWLNDPFDFRPGTLSGITDDELLAEFSDQSSILCRVIEERIDRPLRQKDPKAKTFLELLDSDQAEALRIVRSSWPDIEDGYMKLFWDDAAKWWRLACFALRDDGLLLWTHYADRHRGFVVGFDKSALLNGLPEGSHFPVQYRSKRPAIRHILTSEEEQIKILQQVVSTKSLEWAYEEEYRILLPIAMFTPETEAQGNCRCSSELTEACPQKGPPISHCYWKFDHATVRQVIVGARSEPPLQDEISKILKEPKFGHVELHRAVPHRSHFEIELSPIPPTLHGKPPRDRA